MSGLALVSALAVLSAAPQAAPQDPPVRQDPVEETAPLPDVIVDGRVLREQAQAFVDEVAAPARHRGLARWASRVCIGVGNLRPELSQAVIDHISRVAMQYDVGVGEPGCQPNVLIIFTDDARAMATALVDADRRAFHYGVGGLDRGRTALDAFKSSEAPVRWWHVSMPMVGSTGLRAIRLPGDSGPPMIPGEGRVNKGRPVTDDLNKVIIIVDADQLAGANYAQLSEYLALVTLAQIDPEGDTRGHDTILNVFNDPQGVQGLTEWDHAYLQVLYDHYPERIEPHRQGALMARGMVRARAAEAERGADAH